MRQPAFGPQVYRLRPAVECGINQLTQHSAMVTRYDKRLRALQNTA